MARPRSGFGSLAWAGMGAGALFVVLQLARDPSTGFAALLTAALFSLSICLGGAIFIATQGAANAVWWYPVRSVPLLLFQALPVPAVLLSLVLVFGLSTLYPWSNPDVVNASELLQGKAIWLNTPFFLARAITIFLIWLSFMSVFRARVLNPETGLRRLSALFLVVLAPTISIASWDWAMSLEPEWFSTMFGVTYFSGSFLAGIAGVVVLGSLLERARLLPAPIEDDVRHDLGKLLFGFSCFWAYIWFCEHMLIWYSNLPEEVTHIALRLTSGWTLLFWLNPVLSFAVPFVILMPIANKRNADTLFHVAAVVLVGRWLDTFLMVGPSVGPLASFPLLALTVAVITVGGMALLWRRLLERA